MLLISTRIAENIATYDFSIPINDSHKKLKRQKQNIRESVRGILWEGLQLYGMQVLSSSHNVARAEMRRYKH